MRLYLAGPMRGIKGNNREAFNEARNTLRDMKHEVFCPSEMTDTLVFQKGNTSLRNVMMLDLDWICRYAEGMVMLPGWNISKGALAEIHLAWAIGIPAYNYTLFSRRVIREIKNVPAVDEADF
jgi:nucleoside 2-deoxyribosyltransferase